MRVSFEKVIHGNCGLDGNGIKNISVAIRNHRDALRRGLCLLVGNDKQLMEMYFNKNYSVKYISKLAGVCESTVSRRIGKITDRLLEPRFIFFIRKGWKFDAVERQVLRDYLRDGLSQRKIADKRKLSRYKVRKIITNFKKDVR